MNANEIIQRHDKLHTARSNWNSQLQDIVDYVRPNSTDFGASGMQGGRRADKILDGTAYYANEQLASGLHSYLTSPTERWFNLAARDKELHQDDEALAWLEQVSDLIFLCYGMTSSNFNPAMHEGYLDIGSLGTMIIFQYFDWKERNIRFRSIPLSECQLAENSEGFIDQIYRKRKFTTRQLRQQFQNIPDEVTREKNEDREWTVIHAVYPRSDRNPAKLDGKNKPFASDWICVECKFKLEEGGFDDFPYHVSRWEKRSDEVYGRSPAMTCLGDIKMLQKMSEVVIKAAQKVVDPTLIIESDSIIGPIKTTPASLIYKEAGTEDPKPLLTGAKIEIGLELMDQRREHIMRCFYSDWLRRRQKNERQTTTEILDDRDEMLRLMAPFLGRIQSENLGPMLRRTYSLLKIAGMITAPPPSLAGRGLKIEYISPAARAQLGTKGAAMRRWMADITTVAQVNPETWDAVDTDEYAAQLAIYDDVPRSIIRTREQRDALRQRRSQQQQIQQMSQMGGEVASAVKDLSVAGKNLPQLLGAQ